MNKKLFKPILITFTLYIPFLSYTQTLTNNKVNALKDSVMQIMNRSAYLGVSIAIVNKDSIIFAGGFGKNDIEQNQPVDENTLFWLGSITKSFTALGIMKLVEENKISLKSRVKEIVPELEIVNKWETINPITVENLLEHTSGFDDTPFSAFANVMNQKLNPLEIIKKYQKSFVARWEPSSRFSYSNANYALLGYIIYKLSGMQYEEYVKQNILLPIGMTQTVFGQRYDSDNYASGYIFDNEEFSKIDPIPLYGSSSGGINSTALDMAKFLQFWLNKGKVGKHQVLKETTINEMLRPKTTLAAMAGLQSGYAKGVEYKQILAAQEKSIPFFSNSGRVPGFVSNYYFNQDLNLGIFVANNTTKSNMVFSKLIVKYLSGESNKIQPDKKQILDKNKIAPFLGYYQANNSQIELFSIFDKMMGSGELTIEDDSLYFKPFLGTALSLIPVIGFQFKQPWDARATCILTNDKDHNSILFFRNVYYEKETTIFHWLKLTGLFGTLLVNLSSLIIFVLLLFGLVFKKVKIKIFSFVGLPSLAILLFGIGIYIIAGYLFQMQNIYKVAYMNAYTIAVFITTLLFAIISLISLFRFYKSYKQLKVSVYKYYLLLLHISVAVWLFIFLLNGWIGLRMWAL